MSQARAELLAAIEAGVSAALDRQLPTLAEDVAELVAERLGEKSARSEPELIDANEVARRFGVSRDYVYEHSDELGAIRLGNGRAARLRFDLRRVEQAIGASETAAEPGRRRRGIKRRPVELLPIGSERE